jgi:hypothetical protein
VLHRSSRAELIEHSVEQLVAQRVLALAQEYEDLKDHDALRDDTLLALAVGKSAIKPTLMWDLPSFARYALWRAIDIQLLRTVAIPGYGSR